MPKASRLTRNERPILSLFEGVNLEAFDEAVAKNQAAKAAKLEKQRRELGRRLKESGFAANVVYVSKKHGD